MVQHRNPWTLPPKRYFWSNVLNLEGSYEIFKAVVCTDLIDIFSFKYTPKYACLKDFTKCVRLLLAAASYTELKLFKVSLTMEKFNKRKIQNKLLIKFQLVKKFNNMKLCINEVDDCVILNIYFFL